MPATWQRGEGGRKIKVDFGPLTKDHFEGLKIDPETKKTSIVKRINPEWVRTHFDGVYMQLVMLKPLLWFPVVVGAHREGEDNSPEALVVQRLKVRFQQRDQDHCFTKGMASCLSYCGQTEAAQIISQLGIRFVHMPKQTAIAEFKTTMEEKVPCIGTCEVFNVKNSRGKKKVLSVEDLIQNKTRFPTLVIPYGNDGSNNHAIVVIDDLIFDSTQPYAMKLCRESLDWICGEGGVASINIAMRFNRNFGTKVKFEHKDTTNW